jgi:hypothetical protein
MKRYTYFTFIILTPLLGLLIVTINSGQTMSPSTTHKMVDAIRGCNQGPLNSPTTQIENLDRYADDWGIYCEGSPVGSLNNVNAPSLDSESLRCALLGGTPYSNIHCYRNLLAEPLASKFVLTVPFWFSPTTTFNNQGGPSVIQALEFTMNKWHQGQRYEFALQWQNVGTGAPQWRYWDPHQTPDQWLSLNITATTMVELAGLQWHTLVLTGAIWEDQVVYQTFCLDAQNPPNPDDPNCYVLDITVAPWNTPGEPDQLAVAIQLDGNFDETPYDLFVDQVSFLRSPNQIFQPLVIK